MLNLEDMPWLNKKPRASTVTEAQDVIPEEEVFKFRWDNHGFSTSQNSGAELRKVRPAENPAPTEERYVPHWSFTAKHLPNVGTNRITTGGSKEVPRPDTGEKPRTKLEQKLVDEERYQTRAVNAGLRMLQRSPSAPANHRKLLSATGVKQFAGHHGVSYRGPRYVSAFCTSVSGLIHNLPPELRYQAFGPDADKVIDPDADEPESSIDPELVEFREEGAVLAGLDFNGVTLLGDHQIPYDTPKSWEVHLQSLPPGAGCFIGVVEDTPNLDPAVFLMSPNMFRMRKLLIRMRIAVAGVYFWRGENNSLCYALLENFWAPKEPLPEEESPRLEDIEMTHPPEAEKVPESAAKYVRSYDAKRGFEGIWTHNPEVFDKIRKGLSGFQRLRGCPAESPEFTRSHGARTGASLTQYVEYKHEPRVKHKWEEYGVYRRGAFKAGGGTAPQLGLHVMARFDSREGLRVTFADCPAQISTRVVAKRVRPALGLTSGVVLRCPHAVGAPPRPGMKVGDQIYKQTATSPLKHLTQVDDKKYSVCH